MKEKVFFIILFFVLFSILLLAFDKYKKEDSILVENFVMNNEKNANDINN